MSLLSSIPKDAGTLGTTAGNLLETAGGVLGGSKLGNILGTAGSVLSEGATAAGMFLDENFGDVMQTSYNAFASSMETGVLADAGVKFGAKGELLPVNFKFPDKDPSERLYSSPVGPNIQGLPNIFGLPFTYTRLSDPKQRTYNRTFMQDLPVVTFIPGRPKFNGGLKSFLKEVTLSNEATAAMLINSGIGKSWFDRRYYSFVPDYSEYYTHVNTMLATLHLRMGLFGQFDTLATASNTEINNDVIQAEIYEFSQDARERDRDGNYVLGEMMSISFFVDDLNSGSITENATNSFSSSQVSSAADSNSALMREINYVTGSGSDTFLGALRMKSVIKSMNDNIKNLKSDEIGGLVSMGNASVMKALRQSRNGMQLMFPEIWSDSDFTRSINLNFKFFSPYGDPASIFENVYVPFISLLALSLPRQAGEMGYVSPMLIRADIPGQFTVEMGVVTDFTFTKGGSENLWTKDGYPRIIECSMTIKDLYPALMMTKYMNFMRANPSYTMFIDNMAGISARLNKWQQNLETYLLGYVNRIAGVDDYAANFLTDLEGRLYQTLNTKSVNALVDPLTKNIPNLGGIVSGWLK
jgi:hypothetical protein